MTGRRPIPDGTVSTIRGRWQIPALHVAIVAALVAGVAGMALPGRSGQVAALGAVATVVFTPLLRVAWLCLRWTQERDRRFVLTGASLLAVIGCGALLSALGIG